MENYKKYDQGSFFLGMIEAFSEVVMQEVKKLAFSPVMDERSWSEIKPYAEGIFEKFDVSYYVEENLVSTDLAPDGAVKGKTILLIYRNPEILESYLVLRNRVEDLQRKGLYDKKALDEASVELRRLLSYSEAAIQERRPAAY